MFYYIKLIIDNLHNIIDHFMKHIIHRFSNIPSSIHFSIGSNAQENTYLIDLANRTDIWFHAQDYPSCHVIAQIPNHIHLTKKQIMTIVKMGANICKTHTNKLKNEKSLVITYTQVKHISKSEKDGTVFTSNTKSYVV